MDGYKSSRNISFKSVELVADSRQLKIIHQLYNKKLSHCAHFSHWLSFFFLWDFSLANNIKKHIQLLVHESSNPFLLARLIHSAAKFHIRKLKIGFSIYDSVKQASVCSL